MSESNNAYRRPRSLNTVRTALSVAAVTLGVSSCAELDQYVKSNSNTANCVTGGLLGAITGALVASAAKGDRETIVGAALAAGVVGCVVALSYKDRLNYLERVAREENLQMETQTLALAAQRDQPVLEVGLAVQVRDEGMFPVGSATPSRDGERQIRALAQGFAELDEHQAVLVVGHTDATGSAQGNQRLSEQRARAVAGLLADAGIAPDRMYFQGAGAARPVADNADPALRGQNRRVEIVLVNDVSTLAKRAESERNNPEYLAHGTSTQPASAALAVADSPVPAAAAKPAPSASARTPAARVPLVDFGGKPATADVWELAQLITPKRSGFSLISSAHASNLPLAGCASDNPRISGEVKNFANGRTLNTPATREYLPGMNGRAWAGLANGHLVTLSPVWVLRDGAQVTQDPKVYVTRDYEQNKGNTSHALTATANTWEGEDSILYRVFVGETAQQPLHCLDVVLPKNGERSLGANLVYARGTEPYAADVTLLRN